MASFMYKSVYIKYRIIYQIHSLPIDCLLIAYCLQLGVGPVPEWVFALAKAGARVDIDKAAGDQHTISNMQYGVGSR